VNGKWLKTNNNMYGQAKITGLLRRLAITEEEIGKRVLGFEFWVPERD
jgi:hypothetical protein